MCNRIVKEVEGYLIACGRSWTIEIGARHRIVKIEDRFVCVFSIASNKDAHNVKAKIKTFLRRLLLTS